MLGRSALLAATNSENYGNWLGNYSDVSLLLRNETPGPPGPGTLTDESPTPKTITGFGNAGISTVIFKHGTSSLAFDGSGDYFKAADSNDFLFGTGDFTIECWIYKTATTAQSTILSNLIGSSSGSDIWIFINSNNAVVTHTWFFPLSTSASNVVSNGSWFHIAWTRAGTTARIFVNGQIVNTYTLSTNFSRNTGPTIGAYGAGSDPFTGYIDDLRITKGIARYVEGTGANLGKMVFAGTNDFADPNNFGEFQTNSGSNPDPSYNSVSLLLRNGTPGLPGPPIPLDESPAPKTITAAGNAGISTTIFKYGTSSLAFDGSGDWLEAGAYTDFSFSNNPFTIEAWIRLNNIPADAYGVFSLQNNGGDASISGYVVNIASSGAIGFIDYSNSSTPLSIISNAGVITAGTWIHVAVSKWGTGTNQTAIFANGNLVASGTSNANIPVLSFTAPGRVGAWRYSSAPRSLNGYIDDLRITKNIARYQSTFTPPPAELPNF